MARIKMGKLLLYISILIATLTSVYRARLANKKGDNTWIPLPPVSSVNDQRYSLQQVVRIVDTIVRLVIFNTAHPCLYYAYARCCVLRNNGYTVKLNIGMHNLQPELQAEGHCWISHEGKVLFEEQDPLRMYPDMLGERNSVIYWTSSKGDQDKTFIRRKKSLAT